MYEVEAERGTLEALLGEVANALGVPLGDRPEGIAAVARAWRDRAEAAEARAVDLSAAMQRMEQTVLAYGALHTKNKQLEHLLAMEKAARAEERGWAESEPARTTGKAES